MSANLEVESVIPASPDRVWAILSDLRRMPNWSPQCRRVVARGPIRMGTRMLNLNSDGKLLWPTTAKVTDFSHLQRIAWTITENGTEWSFTLTPTAEGTRVTHRRDIPKGTTSKLSQFLIAKFLGGEPRFENDLRQGMAQTLQEAASDILAER